MVADLPLSTRVIMASAEDSRVVLERIGGMDRELLEQQARADQATAVLQGMQAQQTSNGSSCTAGSAPGSGITSCGRRWLSCRGHKAAAESRGVRWAIDDMEVVQVPVLWLSVVPSTVA